MHKEHIILLADPVYSWETEKKYIWQDDAACAFSPPSMFEVAVPGDRVAEDDKVNEIHDLNETNLRAAQKICGKCPVAEQCLEDATEDDFRWTMRAGIMPSKHSMTPHGRPRKHPAAIDTTKPCEKGHLDWKDRPDGGGTYCTPCKVEYNRSLKVKRGGGKRPAVATVERGERCQYGHNSWTPNGRSAKGVQHWQCRPCKNERDRVRRAEQRADAKLAG